MFDIKLLVKKLVGKKNIQRFRTMFIYPMKLKQNYLMDYHLYKKHSTIFTRNTFSKLECEITLRYHSIEKGFVHSPIRSGFGKQRVIELIELLKNGTIMEHFGSVQVQAAINILCKYFEMHQTNGFDISDYYPEADYQFFKTMLISDFGTKKEHSKESFFLFSNADFKSFSTSRCSVRSFSGEKISKEIIREVITLANNAPSVCNRQPAFVYLIENKILIDTILSIQGGLKSHTETLNQLIVLTCNRNYFYSIGERNQLYIDGGIYLMNLLYALH